MATYKPYKKTDSGKEEIKIPYSVLSNPPDLSAYAKLAGGNTFSGVQTIDAPTNVNGSEQTTMKVKTSNGGAIIFGKEGANSGTMIRLDQTDGTCRLRFRSSATAGAMVWEQPESGAQLYVDLGARDGDYHRVQFPSGAGTLALTSQIPDVSGKQDKLTAGSNITISGNTISATVPTDVVKYTAQTLTTAQKTQARSNIGAGTSNFDGTWGSLSGKPDIVQSIGTSTSSVMSQKATTDAVNGRLSKTDNTNIEVLGTKKATTTLGGNQLYAPNGVIFGGTAAAAGLVTRGICGISTPSVGGACSKENLYINYDGNNDFNAGRQVVVNAGTVGNHLGSNMYQYTVPRGEIVKNWVEAKGYATSVKVNGNTIASSGGVVDIGTVLTDASKFATSAQGTKADNAMPKSGGTFTGNVTFQTVPKVGSSSLALKSEIPTMTFDGTTLTINL